ncbi:MAG: thioredoxin domain-containing protein [Oligoflexia bacterium]|nr:thioredoxin domain-containing protein [Oligoflexia bacterium]
MTIRASLLGLGCLGLALVAAAQTSFADDKVFQQSMDKYLATDTGQQAIGKAVEEYFKKRQEDARKKQEEQVAAQMEEQFKNPTKIDVGSSYVRGPADAKVTIVEFSDFQCPYCKRGKDTMEEVMKMYPKDVKVAFKHMPLPFHNQAMPAAKAALAAGKQGKFWEFHDELFNNQGSLSPEFFVQTATKLGLDVEKFKKDSEDPAIEKAIKDDMELAQKNGIQGTPGFFVNGVAVKGAYPSSHFKSLIDRWLNGGKAVATTGQTNQNS